MNAKRYWVDGMLYEITDGQRQGHDVVMASDFDRLTAECKALQERLNAADQKDDDLEFQLKDREGSRRDWFERAEAAEKRVDRLEGLLRRVVDSGILACYRHEELEADCCAALSASAEPSAKVEAVAKEVYESWASQPGFTPWVDGGNSLKQDEARKAAQVQLSAPVERDERTDFENHPRFKGMDFTRSQFHSDYYESPYSNGCWDGWKARAALDKATEGASHE